MPAGLPMLMDKAYEGNETRQLVLDLEMIPVVPPKSNRLDPWEYDRELYKKRNEVERLFRRLEGFRRIFSRFEKLDVVFLAFLNFVLIVEALRECEHALVPLRGVFVGHACPPFSTRMVDCVALNHSLGHNPKAICHNQGHTRLENARVWGDRPRQSFEFRTRRAGHK
jgi:transposase